MLSTNFLKTASNYLLFAILATLPFARIPSYEVGGSHHVTIRISQVLGLILILVALPLIWQQRRRLLEPIPVLGTVFLLFSALSLVVAHDQVKAALITLFVGFSMALAYSIALVFEPKRIPGYTRWIYAGTIFAVIFGYYQFFGDLAGLPHGLTGLRELYGKIVFGFPRIQSTALEPLFLGNFLLLPIALLLSEIVVGNQLKLAKFGFLLSILTILWLTVSRGALLAGAFMSLLLLTQAVRRGNWQAVGQVATAFILSFLLGIACIAIGTQINHKNQSARSAITNFSKQAKNVNEGESSVSRAAARRTGVEAFKERPLLGLGAGNFGYYAHKVNPGEFKDNDVVVNNEPIEILAETGILGFATFAVFAVLLLLMSLRFQVPLGTGELSVFGLAISSCLIAIAVQYQTFSTLYVTHVWTAIGLLIGAAWSTGARTKGGPNVANSN